MASHRESESVETLSPERRDRPIASITGPEVASWELYEVLGFLGKGAMGSVYKARDRRLGRIVALKFLMGADPYLTTRLLREARALARIEHPNICRIHEVGTIGGRAYLALQLVEGERLNVAAARMSQIEKVAVMRDVAAAIHEAHRRGVVHRDLKPANVMVEPTEDGRWFPVVMDFGLAHEATDDAGLTRPGTVIGTPAYMSPEQARGDTHAIDRRSDVYSLGAMLFELLTGRPPFGHASMAEVLAKAMNEEPPRPRSLVPGVPIDLETITLKCLAKEPAQRYPSARALADDLARYLHGEPILGRRLPLWQRLRRLARRHRALVILGACSIATILAFASFWLQALLAGRAESARATGRTILAQGLGEASKEIELLLRSAYELPLQDVRPANALVRARMSSIAATHHDLGPLGDAVVHEALGRGHLALHEWRAADEELARAAGAGLRTPELHAARGRALGELYHVALEEARRSGDRAWLAGRQKELEEQYLAPALAELGQSRGAAYLEALIALYRHDFVAAEATALAEVERAPWQFEARKLAADAAYGAATFAFDRGDYDAARSRLERAELLYAQASEVARSDASVYEAAAQTALQLAEIDDRQGKEPKAALERAREAIDRALRADPDDAPAYTTKAYVLMACYRDGVGDERQLLVRTAEASSRAVELDPRDVSAWDALGNAHIDRGTYERYHGGRGAPWWNQALDEIGRALAIRPADPWGNNDRAVAHRMLGMELEDTGRDPMLEYQAALDGYERALTIDPQYVYACFNLVVIRAAIAEHDVGLGADPRSDVEGARATGERCLSIDPSYHDVLEVMAQADLWRAKYLVDSGGDPSEALVTVRGFLDRAAAQNPRGPLTWLYRGVAAGTEARFRLRTRADPTSAIAAGRAALSEALRLRPSSASSYIEAARLGLTEATWAAGAGRDTGALLARVRADAEKAAALDDQLAEAKLVAAEVYLQIATTQRSREAVARGLVYANQVLAINPRLRNARTVRDALARL